MDPNRKITKKFTKKFDSKVVNRQCFYMKNSLSMKKLSITNFTTKVLTTF